MRDERKSRAGNHMTRKGNILGKKQSMIYLVVIFILLFINIVLLCKMQMQMKSIHNTLAAVLDELEVYPGNDDALEPDATGYKGAEHAQPDATGYKGEGHDLTGRGTTDYEAGQSSDSGTTGYDTASSGAVSSGTTLDDTMHEPEIDYVNLCGLSEVEVPIHRSRAEALVRLKELSKEDEIIADIYKNNRSYSDNMITALANNPEMADFVAGYLNTPAKATGAGLTEGEKEQEYPLFLQWDPRWGYAEYGDDSNIGLAGCGPVCLSMALYYLLRDESITPDKIAEYSMKNGYYVSGTGTAWSLMSDVPAKYGVDVSQPGVSEQTIKKALDQGDIIICSMKPGDFTAIGHFIVIYGYDENGFQVNDPNCVARSREPWLFEQIGKQIKHIWVLSEKKLDTGEQVEYYK